MQSMSTACEAAAGNMAEPRPALPITHNGTPLAPPIPHSGTHLTSIMQTTQQDCTSLTYKPYPHTGPPSLAPHIPDSRT